MTPAQENSRKIMVAVRENIRRLEECVLHDFQQVPKESQPILSDYVCTKCGGKIEGVEFSYYSIGVRDGRLTERLAARKGGDNK